MAPGFTDSQDVIQVWSGPRCLSTSLMYSFAQRSDTTVLDEPLYAHWVRVTGAERPYREDLLKKTEADGPKVVRETIFGPRPKKYLYAKHIAKQRLPGLPLDVLMGGKHVLLIRDPIKLLPSFDAVVPVTLEETGLPMLVQIWSELRALGRAPPLIDAERLQENPEGVLRALCLQLEIEFQPEMLHWAAGPKPDIDGFWAPWWYQSVHKSTGFRPPEKLPKKPFPPQLYDLLEECRPFYTLLARHALQPVPLPSAPTSPSPLPPSSTSPPPPGSLPPPPPTSPSPPPPSEPALPVPANKQILVWVGRGLVPREEAKVSVFDSVVQGGDAVWEGIRVYGGRVFKLEEHLSRLMDSAKAMAFDSVPSKAEVTHAVFCTLLANGMRDNTHMRLTLTRGPKVTSGMSPHFNKQGPTLIVLAEWKPPVYDNAAGIRLITSAVRRNSPQCLDSKIHHNNLINNILAKVQSNLAGADDAIMLDVDGFVSETNATNLFMVKGGPKGSRVITPTADACLPGITRATVMELAVSLGLRLEERRVSLTEFHAADEVFTTGSMGELTPVVNIDGRQIGNGTLGTVTALLQDAYRSLTKNEGVPLPLN